MAVAKETFAKVVSKLGYDGDVSSLVKISNSWRLAGYKFTDEDWKKDTKDIVRLHIGWQLMRRVSGKESPPPPRLQDDVI